MHLMDEVIYSFFFDPALEVYHVLDRLLETACLRYDPRQYCRQKKIFSLAHHINKKANQVHSWIEHPLNLRT